jgi:hypothetical protein
VRWIGRPVVAVEDFAHVQPGDANHDGEFGRADVDEVLRAGKYLTGRTATFAQGDWNGDGVFNQLDIVAALRTGNYQAGPYVTPKTSSLSDQPSNNVEPWKINADVFAEALIVASCDCTLSA